MSDERRIARATEALERLRSEIQRSFVGQQNLVRGTLVGLLCRGNILLEGPPGLGKTLLVRVLAGALGLRFRRIQFTPDLMPADITGAQVLSSRLAFRTLQREIIVTTVCLDRNRDQNRRLRYDRMIAKVVQ